MASRGTTYDLERFISDLEFENQQYVKQTENERQEIAKFENCLEECKLLRKHKESQTQQIEDTIKTYHRQFASNRDNVLSLRQTLNVMRDHKDALTKKIEILVRTNEIQSNENERLIKLYEDKWNSYREIYESLPKAKKLREMERKHSEVQAQYFASRNRFTELEQELISLQMSTDPNKFIIKLAETAVTYHKSKQEERKLETELSRCHKELLAVKIQKQQEEEEKQRLIEERQRAEEEERKICEAKLKQQLKQCHLVPEETSENADNPQIHQNYYQSVADSGNIRGNTNTMSSASHNLKGQSENRSTQAVAPSGPYQPQNYYQSVSNSGNNKGNTNTMSSASHNLKGQSENRSTQVVASSGPHQPQNYYQSVAKSGNYRGNTNTMSSASHNLKGQSENLSTQVVTSSGLYQPSIQNTRIYPQRVQATERPQQQSSTMLAASVAMKMPAVRMVSANVATPPQPMSSVNAGSNFASTARLNLTQGQSLPAQNREITTLSTPNATNMKEFDRSQDSSRSKIVSRSMPMLSIPKLLNRPPSASSPTARPEHVTLPVDSHSLLLQVQQMSIQTKRSTPVPVPIPVSSMMTPSFQKNVSATTVKQEASGDATNSRLKLSLSQIKLSLASMGQSKNSTNVASPVPMPQLVSTAQAKIPIEHSLPTEFSASSVEAGKDGNTASVNKVTTEPPKTPARPVRQEEKMDEYTSTPKTPTPSEGISDEMDGSKTPGNCKTPGSQLSPMSDTGSIDFDAAMEKAAKFRSKSPGGYNLFRPNFQYDPLKGREDNEEMETDGNRQAQTKETDVDGRNLSGKQQTKDGSPVASFHTGFNLGAGDGNPTGNTSRSSHVFSFFEDCDEEIGKGSTNPGDPFRFPFGGFGDGPSPNAAQTGMDKTTSRNAMNLFGNNPESSGENKQDAAGDFRFSFGGFGDHSTRQQPGNDKSNSRNAMSMFGDNSDCPSDNQKEAAGGDFRFNFGGFGDGPGPKGQSKNEAPKSRNIMSIFGGNNHGGGDTDGQKDDDSSFNFSFKGFEDTSGKSGSSRFSLF